MESLKKTEFELEEALASENCLLIEKKENIKNLEQDAVRKQQEKRQVFHCHNYTYGIGVL